MANNNLKNCMKALAQLNLTDKVTVTVGKNPKQATRLAWGNHDISVSALYKVDEFLNLFNEDAMSEDAEIDEIILWNEKLAEYAQKAKYNYVTSNLNEILTWTCEDYGTTRKELERLHDNWNADPDSWKVSIEKCKDLIYKNELYVPICTLRNACKYWLAAHDLYECNKNNIDLIIDKWVKIGGQ